MIEAARRKPLGKLPPRAKAWVAERGFVPSDAMVKQAVVVMEKIKNNSEQRELWAESGSLQSWLNQMDTLLAGLREVQCLAPPIRLAKAPAPRKLEKIIEKVKPDEESPLRLTLRKKLEALTDLEASVTGAVVAKSPLTLLAQQGLLPEAKRLVERGTRINPERKGQINFTPLGQACWSGHAEMARWLLEQGATLGRGDFSRAVKSGSIATLEVLLPYHAQHPMEGLDERSGHDPPLHKAVDARHPHVIEYLVKNGFQVDARNSLGMTPLSWAVNQAPFEEMEKVVEKLLSLGADTNAKDKVGLTVLDLVVGYTSWGVSYPDKILELIKIHGGSMGREV